MASNISDNSVDAEIPFMDPLDVELLAEAGYNISFASKIVIAGLTAYGAYFVVAAIALYTVVKRSQKTLRSAVLLTALIVTFIITTLQCALDIALLQFMIESSLIDSPELPYLLRIQVFGSQSWFNPAITLESIITTGMDVGLLFIINDCLAVWRAVSFYRFGGRRQYALILYFFVFTTVGFYVSAIVLQILETYSSANSDLSTSYPLTVVLITGSSISIAINAVDTFLIGYSAYKYKIFLSKEGIASRGGKIMVLLAESGLLYGLIQIVRMALSISNDSSSVPLFGPLDTADKVVSSATAVITAMYTPTLIIIIHYGYSMAETVHQDDLNTDKARTGRRQGGDYGQPNALQVDSTHTISTMAFGRAERNLDFRRSTLRQESQNDEEGSKSTNNCVFDVSDREKVKSFGEA